MQSEHGRPTRTKRTRFGRWTRGVLLLVAALSGCGSGAQLGEVEGRVLLDGRPLEQVRVSFLPDPQHGSDGAHSTAVTDAQGRYRLSYSSESGRAGAVVGWHRITIEDLAAENMRDAGRPPAARLDPVYSSAHRTPLAYEVRPGMQRKDVLLTGDPARQGFD